MKTVPGLILSLLLAAAPMAMAQETPPAPPATPEPGQASEPAGIVRGIYESYFEALNTARDSSTVEWTTFVEKHLASDLAPRVKKMASAEGGFGVDMLISAQDYSELTVTAVEATTIDAASATVRVTFTNFGEPNATDVKLAKGDGGWKITDLVIAPGTPDEYTLTGVLQENGF